MATLSSKSVQFFAARLKNSSLAEIVYRIRQLAFWGIAWTFRTIFLKPFPAPESEIDSVPHMTDTSGDIPSTLVEDILSGLSSGPFHHARDFDERVQENSQADTEGRCPEDIRTQWEAGRLQHLSLLLHAMRAGLDGGRAKNIKSFVGLTLLDWLRNNPFPKGLHYLCAMECAMRIPLLLFVLRDLEMLRPKERGEIIQAIFYHAWLIRNRLSLYSSLGNHTIAECVGLVMAGALFARKDYGGEWLRTGIRLLEQESSHQILDDGGPSEQSISYHRMVLDLYWLGVGFLEANNLHDCSGIRARLSKGEDFMSGVGEPPPSIGDSDDGFAVAPGLRPACKPNYESIRATEVSAATLRVFSDTGLSVLHFPGGTRLTFDHGPLGMAPLFNHGHADALSITLCVRDIPFLIDPGTYRYNGAGNFRSYFKGTRAHNTVAIDGEDQARQVTGFIWDKPYQVFDFSSDSKAGKPLLSAGHDGYSRLQDPVFHYRTIIVNEPTSILIEDRFQGSGVHLFEINYHLHPDVEITLDGQGTASLKVADTAISLQILEGQMEVIVGRRDPLLGWYSPSYGKLEKTSVLHCELRGQPNNVRFTTKILLR